MKSNVLKQGRLLVSEFYMEAKSLGVPSHAASYVEEEMPPFTAEEEVITLTSSPGCVCLTDHGDLCAGFPLPLSCVLWYRERERRINYSLPILRVT